MCTSKALAAFHDPTGSSRLDQWVLSEAFDTLDLDPKNGRFDNSCCSSKKSCYKLLRQAKVCLSDEGSTGSLVLFDVEGFALVDTVYMSPCKAGSCLSTTESHPYRHIFQLPMPLCVNECVCSKCFTAPPWLTSSP